MINLKFKKKKLSDFNHIVDIYEAKRIMNTLYKRWFWAAYANRVFVAIITALCILLLIK